MFHNRSYRIDVINNIKNYLKKLKSFVAQVGLEPTPSYEDLLLRQARLPFRHWAKLYSFLH